MPEMRGGVPEGGVKANRGRQAGAEILITGFNPHRGGAHSRKKGRGRAPKMVEGKPRPPELSLVEGRESLIGMAKRFIIRDGRRLDKEWNSSVEPLILEK